MRHAFFLRARVPAFALGLTSLVACGGDVSGGAEPPPVGEGSSSTGASATHTTSGGPSASASTNTTGAVSPPYESCGCPASGITAAPPPDAGIEAGGTTFPGSSTSEPGTTSSSSSSSASTANRETSVILPAGPPLYVNGSIASDGDTVFFVAEYDPSGAGTPTELYSCPASGCPNDTPNVFWPSVNLGAAPGNLLVAGGRLYFQLGDDGPGNVAAIVDCPVSGCGAAPSQFTVNVHDSIFAPALADDGTDLYWLDKETVHACALGDTCPSPRTVAKLASGSYVAQLATYGGAVYWVEETTSELETVPSAGGPITKLCSLPGGMPGTIAVLDGYAYVAGTSGATDTAGVYRCDATAPGQATLFADDIGATDITTDGTSIFWLTAWQAPVPYEVRSRPPGATCGVSTNVVGPISQVNYNFGFAAVKSSVYSAGSAILRTHY